MATNASQQSGRVDAPGQNTSRGADVHHSKEDALSDREFELLVEGTYHMKDLFDLEARVLCFLAGRLGMRAGEICHMKETWIDWRRRFIVIPPREKCNRGREGGQCGHCRQAAKQKAEVRTKNAMEEVYENLDEDAPLEPGNEITPEIVREAEEFMDGYWRPKTDCAAREIPFDANTRAELMVERFFERFDEWKTSQSGINRRLKTAAEHADDLDPEDVKPHGLRATAASYFASRGLNVIALKSMMGWVEFSTARSYLASSGENTARAIRDVRI